MQDKKFHASLIMNQYGLMNKTGCSTYFPYGPTQYKPYLSIGYVRSKVILKNIRVSPKHVSCKRTGAVAAFHLSAATNSIVQSMGSISIEISP